MLKQYKKLFDYDNIDLIVEDDALMEIAKKAIAQKTGARGLRSIIEDVLMQPMFEVPSNPDVTGIKITAKSIMVKKSRSILQKIKSKFVYKNPY